MFQPSLRRRLKLIRWKNPPTRIKKVEPEEKTAKRRGRPPKEQDSPQGDKPEKGPEPRTGRPAKADKAARGESPSPALDKVSRSKEQELEPSPSVGEKYDGNAIKM